MKINTGPVRDWLGYTRGERRATVALLIVIFIITFIRYGFPSKSMVVERSEYIAYLDAGQAADSGSDHGTVEIMEDPVPSSFAVNYHASHQLSQSAYSRQLRGAGQDSLQAGGKRAFIDINSCDSVDLVALRGIGPILSARIIKYRNLIGGYASVEQLREVYGLSGETYSEIKDMLRADTTLIRKININTAGYRDLCRIPYLEKYDVTSVLKYRELKGRIASIGELVSASIISPEKASRSSPYIIFDQR